MKSIRLLVGLFLVSQLIVVGCQNEAVETSQNFIKNGSFEGKPMIGNDNVPNLFGDKLDMHFTKFNKTWNSCLFTYRTFPDIHVDTTSFHEVKKNAADGSNFLGLVTRNDKTYESIEQELSSPLLQGECYIMCAYLSYYEFLEGSANTDYYDLRKFFNNPITIKVVGTNENCKEEQVFFHSKPIDHENWLPYVFRFSPKKDFKQIRLIATPVEKGNFKDGNILIDDISIKKVICDSIEFVKKSSIEQMMAKIESKEKEDRRKFQDRLKAKSEGYAELRRKQFEIVLDSVARIDGKINVPDEFRYNYGFCRRIGDLVNEYSSVNFIFKVLDEKEMGNCLKHHQAFYKGRMNFVFDPGFQIESPDFETESFQLKIVERPFEEINIAEKEQWQMEVDLRKRRQNFHLDEISKYLSNVNKIESNFLLIDLKKKFFIKNTYVQWIFEFKKKSDTTLLNELKKIEKKLEIDDDAKLIISANMEENYGKPDFENSDLKIKVVPFSF